MICASDGDDAEGDLAEGLLRDGSLRTDAFDAARSGRKRLIVGRKGSGKSAVSMAMAATTDAPFSPSRVVPDFLSKEAPVREQKQPFSAQSA